MPRGVKAHLTGQRFGHVTVLAEHVTERAGSWWKCRCDCGNECIKSGSDLRRPMWVHSCGCRPSLVTTIREQFKSKLDRHLLIMHAERRHQHR